MPTSSTALAGAYPSRAVTVANCVGQGGLVVKYHWSTVVNCVGQGQKGMPTSLTALAGVYLSEW